MRDINKAYTWAIQTCNAPNVGYSQDYRNQKTVKGITYYDCSSFIWYSLKAGGWDLTGWPFTTDTMRSKLASIGFTEVDANGQIKPGDIGWKVGHTEMCYQGGIGRAIFMGAHTGNATLANQVSIGDSKGDATAKRSFTQIWRYGDGGATGYGISIYVVAAICGNWWTESGINPGVYESLKVVPLTDDSVYGGYGLGQWTNNPTTGVKRRTNLANYLSVQQYPYDSPEGQLNFFIQENVWFSTGAAAVFSSLSDFLASTSQDLDMLTRAFSRGWEGQTVFNTDRYDQAVDCLNYIRGHANDTSIDHWVIGNKYNSRAEILNNAVMLYRWFSAGGGGGGTTGSALKHMPLWMKINYRIVRR